jgi:glucokinase
MKNKLELVYAFDIGGSSMKHALVEVSEDRSQIVERYDTIEFSSPRFEEVENSLLGAISDSMRAGTEVSAVGISTTGSVDANGVVLNAGHFENYTNVDWQTIIREAEPRIKRVSTTNDGRASTWAEFQSRAAQCGHFAHFVVGTGIGGAAIVKGKIVMGGQAGHFGHLKVTSEPTIRCSCGQFGCLESVAAAPAILASYERFRGSDRPTQESPLKFEDFVEVARQGQDEAIKALETAGEWLGVGMSILMTIINPKFVTVGGGVAVASLSLESSIGRDPFLSSAIASAKRHSHKRVVPGTMITAAMHGNDGGLLGAAALAVAGR